jgi:molecular chaperone DnaK
LSKDDIEKMVKQAQENASEDKKKRDAVESKNKAESLIFEVEKNLKEHKDKLTESDVKNIESKVQDTKAALEKNDVDAIKKSTDELQQAAMKIGEVIYKQQQEAQAKGSQPDAQQEKPKDKKDENVVDAEFEESKD